MLDPEQYGTYCRNDLLYTDEPLSGYVSGGYHPVSLGGEFNEGRYVVSHKLGWGLHSTVWHAYDRQEGERVALKILVAAPPKKEWQTLKRLAGHAQQGDLAKNNIVQYLGDFTHQGPNGFHQCIVLELLGPDLRRFAHMRPRGYPRPMIDGNTVRRMAGHLIKAVSFMYNAGMDHEDLQHAISGRKVAITCAGLSLVKLSSCYQIMGFPRTEHLVRIDGMDLDDGVPIYLVQTAKWPGVIDARAEQLRLIGFGGAFRLDPLEQRLREHPAVTGLKLVQGLLRSAPERYYDTEEACHFLTAPPV